MYATSDVADRIGVSRNTLLRWLAEGLLRDVERDWRGWRVWSAEDVERARAFKEAYHARAVPRVRQRRLGRGSYTRQAAEAMRRSAQAWGQRAMGHS